jgi:hypothetical protein
MLNSFLKEWSRFNVGQSFFQICSLKWVKVSYTKLLKKLPYKILKIVAYKKT